MIIVVLVPLALLLHNFSNLHTPQASRRTIIDVDFDSRNVQVVSRLATVAGLVSMARKGTGQNLLSLAGSVQMRIAGNVDTTRSLIVGPLMVWPFNVWIWNMVHHERLLLIFQLG